VKPAGNFAGQGMSLFRMFHFPIIPETRILIKKSLTDGRDSDRHSDLKNDGEYGVGGEWNHMKRVIIFYF